MKFNEPTENLEKFSERIPYFKLRHLMIEIDKIRQDIKTSSNIEDFDRLICELKKEKLLYRKLYGIGLVEKREFLDKLEERIQQAVNSDFFEWAAELNKDRIFVENLLKFRYRDVIHQQDQLLYQVPSS